MDQLTRVLAEQERQLLSAESSDAARAAILADDFLEFGSSGRVYDKAAILELLRNRGPIDFSIEHFQAAQLAPGVALATYEFVVKPAAGGAAAAGAGGGAGHAIGGRSAVDAGGSGGTAPRRSLRSSIFVERGGVWLMRFHQGTPVP